MIFSLTTFYLKNDEGFDDRMVIASRYLEGMCSFKSTSAHATTFGKALFNNNFRSIHCWRKAEISNRRPTMNYDVVFSLIPECRTWVITSFIRKKKFSVFYLFPFIQINYMRAKHAALFEEKQLDRASEDPNYVIQVFNEKAWNKVFRKLFTTSGTELWTITTQVRL